jgi:hypothetical protein
MPTEQTQDKKAREALRSAQISTLFFGLGMLVWGFAPAIIQRVVSGGAPPVQTFAVGSITILVGLVLLALVVPVGRARTWALKTALIISAIVLAGSLAMLALSGMALASIYPLLLSASTAGTTWLAMLATRQQRQPGQVPGAA